MKKDLNIPEFFDSAVYMAEMSLLAARTDERMHEVWCLHLNHSIVQIKAGLRAKARERAGTDVTFNPDEEYCCSLVEKASKEYLNYKSLCRLIVILRENNLAMPKCFEKFINSILLGSFKPPKKPSQMKDWYRHREIQGIIIQMQQSGFYPLKRDKNYPDKKSIFDVIVKANENVKVFDGLTFDAVNKSYYKEKIIHSVFHDAKYF